MTKAPSRPAKATDGQSAHRVLGSQTLVRGLEVMQAVAAGTNNLASLAQALNLNRSTAHRLASTLVEYRYLSFAPHVGYALGPKLLELGYLARAHMSLPRVARSHLEELAKRTGDTVHLGVLDGMRALYLDKIPGNRRIVIASRIGDRQPLRSTGLGKALLLDMDEQHWRAFYAFENSDSRGYDVSLTVWLKRMKGYARNGYALDLEENEDRIRCVAAPVRDATNAVVGAISISSAAQYMDDSRMNLLAEETRATARAISEDLGWNGAQNQPAYPKA